MEKQNYTIKIIPDDGSATKSISLSANLLKYGLASLCAGGILTAAAFGYAVYTSYNLQSSQNQIEELQQVNSIQQEQLLQLTKQANSMQDQLDELGQVEMELRQISGISGGQFDSKNSNDSQENAVHDGQGGPIIEPDMANVRIALNDLERKVTMRRNSLNQLKEEMRQQRGGLASYAGSISSVPSIWPSGGDVSSPYGLRWNGTDFHPGIDIANDFGTPIVATADGTVIDSGWNSGGYGNMVDIDHGNGYATRYAHAQQVVVSPGQYVRRGQIIAYMGSTGYSTGPHVHYEVRVNGQAINPIGFL